MENTQDQIKTCDQSETVAPPKRITPKLVVFKDGVAHVCTFIDHGQVMVESQFVEGKVLKVNDDYSPEKLADMLSK